ncbi:hypothetical protein TruAng_000079 [Truncatella angustata]|nr:hypothetical protein TruAng_000079 [Truncatella angustata]
MPRQEMFAAPVEGLALKAMIVSVVDVVRLGRYLVVVEPEEAPEFSCIPVTVTNSAGAVLELGDDCALEYTDPEPTESSSDAGNVATSTASAVTPVRRVNIDAYLIPRQTACTPYTTVTSTTTSTIPTTTRRTTTVTKTVEASEEGFSCPAMAVTNSVGDELALNEECQFEFTPAEPTSSEPSGNSASASGVSSPSGSGTNAGGSAAVTTRGTSRLMWRYLYIGVVGIWLSFL